MDVGWSVLLAEGVEGAIGAERGGLRLGTRLSDSHRAPHSLLNAIEGRGVIQAPAQIDEGIHQQEAAVLGPNPTSTLVANSSRSSGTAGSPRQAALSCPDCGSPTAVGNSPPVSTLIVLANSARAPATRRTSARNSPQRPLRSPRTDRDDERTIGVRYGFDSEIPTQDDSADRSIRAPPVRA